MADHPERAVMSDREHLAGLDPDTHTVAPPGSPAVEPLTPFRAAIAGRR